MNRLICQRCNKNLAGAAKLLGVDEVKRWHDAQHRLRAIEGAQVVVELARNVVIHLPDDRGDALRKALLDLDQFRRPVEPLYLEYEYPERQATESSEWCADNDCEPRECHWCFPVQGCRDHDKCRDVA